MHGWLTSDERFFYEEEEAIIHEAKYEFAKYYNDGFLGKRSLDGVSPEQILDWLEEHSIEIQKYYDQVLETI